MQTDPTITGNVSCDPRHATLDPPKSLGFQAAYDRCGHTQLKPQRHVERDSEAWLQHIYRTLGSLIEAQGDNNVPPLVAPAPYVTISLAAIITGLTEKAIRRKIEDGKWIEGREYRRSPDGGIFISIKGYLQWVERVAA